MLDNEKGYLRWEAAIALGTIGDKQAVPALIRALNDEDKYVRSNTATALRVIGGKEAEEALAGLNKTRPE